MGYNVFLLQGLLQHGEHCAADYGANEDGDEVHHRVADGGDYEDAAVGSAEGAVEGHGESACYGRADDAGGNHADGVTCSKGDSALSDEGHAHDVVHDAGLLLAFSEAVLEEGGAECDGQRRHHAACHDGSHHMILAGSQKAGAGDVSSLVDGAAHVDSHHACYDNAHEDTGRGIHVGQGLSQPGVDSADRRRNDVHGDEAHEEDAEEGIEENGLHAVQAGGNAGESLLQKVHNPAAQEAGQQSAQEA